MYKKISLILVGIILVCFAGTLIFLPLGIRSTLKEMQELTDGEQISAEKINLDSSIETLVLDYFGDVEFVQSPSDDAYIEVYNTDSINQHYKLQIIYPEAGKAILTRERVFGNISLEKEKIKKTFLKEIQNYPDAVVYIPKRMNIESDTIYWLNKNIEFKNKAELIEEKKLEEEKEEQRRQEQAKQQWEQRQEESKQQWEQQQDRDKQQWREQQEQYMQQWQQQQDRDKQQWREQQEQYIQQWQQQQEQYMQQLQDKIDMLVEN